MQIDDSAGHQIQHLLWNDMAVIEADHQRRLHLCDHLDRYFILHPVYLFSLLLQPPVQTVCIRIIGQKQNTALLQGIKGKRCSSLHGMIRPHAEDIFPVFGLDAVTGTDNADIFFRKLCTCGYILHCKNRSAEHSAALFLFFHAIRRCSQGSLHITDILHHLLIFFRCHGERSIRILDLAA